MRSLSKYAISLVLLVAITLMPTMASASQNETPITTTTIVRTVTTDPCIPGDAPCWKEHKQRQENERVYWAEVVKQQKERARIARIFAFAAAVEAHRLATAREGSLTEPGGRLVQGIAVCGSWFPCHIVARESGFNPQARNPRSTAGGLYQFLRFWLPYCGLSGYSNFSQVPVIDQVRCAKKVVRQHGLSPWRL